MKFKTPIEVQAGISDGDPTNPLGQAGYLLSSDGSQVSWVSPGGLSAKTAEVIVQPIKANEALVKGDPVYIVGFNAGQNTNIVAKADSSDAAKMPVVGLADANYANQAFGTMTAFGSFNGSFDSTGGTENWAIGDIIFVKPGGGLTNVKPVGTDLIQNVAIVSRVNSQTGELEVIALGRTNDVPNLPVGRLFVGTSDNTSLTSDVVYIDDANDRVGIGTTSPGAKLDVLGDVLIDSGEYLSWGTAGATSIEGSTASNKLQFRTSSTNRMIINDTGVGIGTDSPNAKLDVKETTSDVAGEIIVGGLIASDNVPFGKISFANTASSNAQTNDILASIAGEKVGSSNRGELTFSTSDSAAPTERMRIDSSGNVGIGTTSPGYKLDVSGDGRFTGTVHSNKLEYGGSSSTYLDFGINSITLATGSTSALSINSSQNVFIGAGSLTVTTSTVTATNFILSSDERLKENIEKARDNRIKADWKTFELKTEKGQKRYGVIAQELEKTNPEFVREDTQGFKSVAYIDLLIAKIAELEARLEKAGI